jgi:hypothetical protein
MIPIKKVPFGALKGLYQGIDKNLMDFSYSPDCQNVDVSNGILSTRKGITKHIAIPVAITDATYGIGYAHKLMWLESVQGAQITDLSTTGVPIIGVYFANSGTPKIQWYAYHKTAAAETTAGWNLITTNGTTPAMTDISPDYAHFIEYKISGVPYLIAAGGGAPQKLHVVYGGSPGYTYSVISEALSANAPDDAVYVALHRERVWMAGDVDGVSGQYVAGVNTLSYSNAYDPTDWTTALQTGSIVVETFDGDYLRGIANLLDDVVAFKKNTVWKVMGDTPSDYEMVQVYSVQGTVYGDSICSDGSYCFFAGEDGIYYYDGVKGGPLLVDEIKALYAGMGNVKGLVANNKLYMWDRQTIVPSATYTGKCIVFDVLAKTVSVNYTNNMYDCMVRDGKVLFTDGNYIYEL